jgi:glucokinase
MPKTQDVIVGVDLGGTSLRALAVNGRNQILAMEKIPTNRAQRPSRLIADIARVVREAVRAAGLRMREVRAVSVGAPGPTDPVRGIVHKAPNLGWHDVALASRLRALLRVPVIVDNDVHVGGIGEYALGAGRGSKDMVAIFVGTGIGGAVISDGRLYDGSSGGAGEIGHMVLAVAGPVCGCGHRGCVEALASRTAMEREVRAAIKNGRKSIVLKIMKETHHERMTSSIVAKALKKNDKVLRKVMQNSQHYLGILVANVVNLLDPDRVVIGGGINERLGEEFVGPIRATAYEYFLRPKDVHRVRIVGGILGDNAGALGAVVLARQRLRKV